MLKTHSFADVEVATGDLRRKDIEELSEEENDDEDEVPKTAGGSGKKGEKCPSDGILNEIDTMGIEEEFEREEEYDEPKEQIFPAVGKLDSQSQFQHKVMVEELEQEKAILNEVLKKSF